MRRRLVDGAKRIAGEGASALHRVAGRRAGAGFGILLYHRVATPPPGVPAPTWNVPPQQFRRQLEGLLARGVAIWPLRRLIACVENGDAVPENVTAITFDDGYGNNCVEAWPVLDELSAPATVFVATAYVGSSAPFPFDDWGSVWHGATPPECWRPLDWEQCRAMEASGLVEIGTHTHTHRDFRGAAAALRADLERSKREIDRRLGERAPGPWGLRAGGALFAFPFGAPELGFVAEDQLDAARCAGALCALTTEGALVRRGASPFGWGRFEVTASDTAATIAAKLGGWYDWMSTAKRCFVRLSPPPYLRDQPGRLESRGVAAQRRTG